MKRVYTAQHSTDAHLLADVLESHGIPSATRGTNYGWSSEARLWDAPSVWIVEDADFDRAMELVEEYSSGSAAEPTGTWECPTCGEAVGTQFDKCWNCDPAGPEARESEVVEPPEPTPVAAPAAASTKTLLMYTYGVGAVLLFFLFVFGQQMRPESATGILLLMAVVAWIPVAGSVTVLAILARFRGPLSSADWLLRVAVLLAAAVVTFSLGPVLGGALFLFAVLKPHGPTS